VRIALVTPISPRLAGNGLAHRARFWLTTLGQLGEVTTLVIPLSGPFVEGYGDICVDLPQPTSGAPRAGLATNGSLGMHWAQRLGTFDLIVAFRAHTASFAIGLAGRSLAPLIVDLDDDDVAFHRQAGDHAAADEFAKLIDLIDQHAALTVAATATVAGRSRREVPNSVDRVDTSGPAISKRPQTVPPTAVMVGNFTYAPNIEGARWFIDDVLPLVVPRRPDFAVHLIGPGSEAFGEFGRGFVDDLGVAYCEAHLALVPVLRGSGTRIKAIEAWAHGLPVVATSHGLLGLAYEAGREALIGDDPASFANHVCAVLDDPALADRLSQAGRQLVDQAYTTDVVGSDALAALRNTLEAVTGWPLHPLDNLDITEVEEGLVVFEPVTGQVHHLNATAAIVFSLIEGPRSDDDVTGDVQALYSLTTPPTSEVSAAIDSLLRARLITRRPIVDG
jgi:O-antigen biosynthesis protein